MRLENTFDVPAPPEPKPISGLRLGLRALANTTGRLLRRLVRRS